jgi:membrane-associated phospholipid phosphatase
VLYVPATFVAISRVEEGRHWPSDVSAGAFLVFLTNWIYNAHYGDTKADRPSIYLEPRGVWRVRRDLDGDPGIVVSFSF